ncbi:MAG TPA: MBL fold metallo-hydrolase, partial [Nevskiales bacterium]|nr:MBL fold metallo-hydrolase [Nevskiales bacterium]
MRFAYLGSGSRGNAALIQAGRTLLLLDCGFSVAETERRLARLGVTPADLAAIVVTHEHADHLGGVARLARKHRLPVWMTRGTHAAWLERDVPMPEFCCAHTAFALGDIELAPYPVPHDAREPCQFVFSDGQRRIGVLSDAGHITPHIRASLSGCDALLLECNHDPAMLADGPYPERLKARVGGPLGHLSNAQAAALLGEIDVSRLQHLVATHISETNNRPGLVRAALAAALNCDPGWIAVAEQEQGLDWREVS